MGRKNAKFRLAMWSVVTVVLISLFVGGLSSSYGLYNIFNVVQIGTHSKKLSKTNEWIIKADGLQDINVDLTVDDIIIRTSGDKDIKIVESSNYKLSEKEELKISENSKSVSIYRDNKVLGGLSFGQNKLRRIDIYIPENYKESLSVNNNVGNIDVLSNLDLDQFVISQNVGDLNVEGDISCNNFTAKSSTGNIDVGIVNTKEYEIKSSVGDIDLRGLSGKGTIKAATGDINCGIDRIDGDISIDSKVGDVEVSVVDGLSFELDAKCSVGDINSDFPVTTSKKDGKEVMSSIGENISSTMKIRSDIGDIDINRK